MKSKKNNAYDNDKIKSGIQLLLWILFIVFVLFLVRNIDLKEVIVSDEVSLSLNEMLDNLENGYEYEYTVFNKLDDHYIYYIGKNNKVIDEGIKKENDEEIKYYKSDYKYYNSETLEELDDIYLNNYFLDIDSLKKYSFKESNEGDLRIFKTDILYDNNSFLLTIKTHNNKITYVNYNIDNTEYIINIIIN